MTGYDVSADTAGVRACLSKTLNVPGFRGAVYRLTHLFCCAVCCRKATVLPYHGSDWDLFGQRGFRPTEAVILLGPVSRGLIQQTAPTPKFLMPVEFWSNATGGLFLSGFPVSETSSGCTEERPWSALSCFVRLGSYPGRSSTFGNCECQILLGL